MTSIDRRSALKGIAFAATMLPASMAGAQGTTASPADASVYIINLKNGDTVTSPFKVQFGMIGMGVAPVGVQNERTGHHHLMIDTKLSDEELKRAIPADAQHVHFGGGQTETTVTLDPSLKADEVILDGTSRTGDDVDRAAEMLGRLRSLAFEEQRNTFARVETVNHFPTASGLASSALAVLFGSM